MAIFQRNKKKIGFFMIHGFLGNGRTSFGNLPAVLLKNGIKEYKIIEVQGHGEDEDINDLI